MPVPTGLPLHTSRVLILCFWSSQSSKVLVYPVLSVLRGKFWEPCNVNVIYYGESCTIKDLLWANWHIFMIADTVKEWTGDGGTAFLLLLHHLLFTAFYLLLLWLLLLLLLLAVAMISM